MASLDIGRLHIDAGWYPGENFRVFDLEIGEVIMADRDSVGAITLFCIQIARLLLVISWDMD